MNIRYDPAVLAAGATQALLRVHKLVGTTWTPLAGSSVNVATHVVTGTTSSFSTYAVLEIIPTVRSITLNPTSANVFVGATKALVPTIDADVTANAAITWTSSNNALATVDANGTVTGVAVGGPVTITARSVLVPTVVTPATITVSVSPPLTQWISHSTGVGEAYAGAATDIWTTASGDAFAVFIEQGQFQDYYIGIRRNGDWQQRVNIPFGLPDAVGGFGNEVWLGTHVYGSSVGAISRWDGTQFVPMSIPAGVSWITQVVGVGPGDAVAAAYDGNAHGYYAGSVVLRLQNGVWTRLHPRGGTLTCPFPAFPIRPSSRLVVSRFWGRRSLCLPSRLAARPPPNGMVPRGRPIPLQRLERSDPLRWITAIS